MRKLVLIILAAVLWAQPAFAVDSHTIKQSLVTAKTIETLPVTAEITDAVRKILSVNPALERRFSDTKVYNLATAVAKAHYITGVDWKIILAISYVESRMCLNVKGDIKPDEDGRQLFDYWSVGCMQVNMRWWGQAISKAGLQQHDMLDYENSIIIGSLILKHYVDKYDGDWKAGVKRYNGSGAQAEAYRAKVLKIYDLIAV